ncbi:MAG: tRNA 4-thiouridine(8) synthase ThiI [Candidatus Freyarchaeota archaeon]|nr:tRNA 4-thiouridine(8) synthase ThiI [Candidatus Jordarchaeia archaeon]
MQVVREKDQCTYNSVIVRFGCEVGVKSSKTRLYYEKEVCRHIRNLLEKGGVEHDVKYVFGRAYVTTRNAIKASELVTRVFGVSSASPALETTSKMEDIIDAALKIAENTLKGKKSFAVRCRRTGIHPYTSVDVCREVGGAILRHLKRDDLKVDLKNPEVAIKIEVRDDKSYVYTGEYEGPGGFPLGVQGKVVCLLSGGMDSPVACWLAMKRGAAIIPVYFDASPAFSDEASRVKALECARILFDWTTEKQRTIYVVPHEEALATIRKKCPEGYTCVICKRVMYRVAERIAEAEGAEGIVTGEALGEQASQTLANLIVLNEAAKKYPVHRPLLCFDKTETERLARKIGTYEVSARRSRGCTAAPKHPVLRAKLERVLEIERNIDAERLIEEALKKAEKVEV